MGIGKRAGVGSPRYAAEQGPLHAKLAARIAAWEGQGKTVVAVMADGAPAGLIAVRDEPRHDAAAGIRQLRAPGVNAVMLSGDNRRTAWAVAASVGLNAVAELLPETTVGGCGCAAGTEFIAGSSGTGGNRSVRMGPRGRPRNAASAADRVPDQAATGTGKPAALFREPRWACLLRPTS